jgi:uncharacterized protein YoaH (UPF0181 family)
MIKKRHLKETKPENVIRLAKWLKLRIDGMSTKQIIALVAWRLHKNRQWGGFR